MRVIGLFEDAARTRNHPVFLVTGFKPAWSRKHKDVRWKTDMAGINNVDAAGLSHSQGMRLAQAAAVDMGLPLMLEARHNEPLDPIGRLQLIDHARGRGAYTAHISHLVPSLTELVIEVVATRSVRPRAYGNDSHVV